MKTTTTIRALVSLGVLAGAVATAHDASGGESPAFSELPVGQFSAPPKKKVAFVAARESVPGVFVQAPEDAAALPYEHRIVTITTEPPTHDNDSPRMTHATCITEANRVSSDEDDSRGTEWDENLSTQSHAFPRVKDNPLSGVRAIHTERVVEQNGSAALEWVDAWVDPNTRGTRLISNGSLPLKLVRTPAFGMKVFAGRDERPDGKRFVQFVVVHPPASEVDQTGQMWAMRADGAIAHTSSCRHQRIAVSVDDKSGDGATVVATVVLPKLDANGKVIDDAPEKASGSSAPPAIVPRKPLKKRRLAFRSPASGDSASTEEREVRTRMMHIQVSVSQMSREKEPLVSVSSAWGGREQVERVVER